MSDELLKEGIDYMLVPVDAGNEQAWHIRVDKGVYTESVLSFGNIAFDGKNDRLNFNFDIVYSPIAGLTTEDVDLQEFAGLLLSSILNKAIDEKELLLTDGDETLEY